MAGYKFKPYGSKPGPDDDVLASRGHAEKLRRELRKAGHDAHVEASGKDDPEHRVWIQHPKHRDSVAYVSRSDTKPLTTDKDHEPQWVRKT